MTVTKVCQMYGNVLIVWKRCQHEPWTVEGRGISLKYKRRAFVRWTFHSVTYPFSILGPILGDYSRGKY